MATWLHHKATHNDDHPLQMDKRQEQDATTALGLILTSVFYHFVTFCASEVITS